MFLKTAYPTDAHAGAAAAIVRFFAGSDTVDSVLLVNSCARGKASRDSCLDILVLVPEAEPGKAALEQAWARYHLSEPIFRALERVGRFSVVHLDISDGHEGQFQPGPLDEDQDFFEVQIGNAVVYSVPLWERGNRLAQLRTQWLPYYDEELRQERLGRVCRLCLDHLDHISPYVERELYFQSFARLHWAFDLFLQALFIARRTYPIAYNKWIREQVAEILGLPELYEKLPHLFEIQRFESAELTDKADDLRGLLNVYAPRSDT
jgi:predicted nucleotidyltransferase